MQCGAPIVDEKQPNFLAAGCFVARAEIAQLLEGLESTG